ncbi:MULTISPECIES: hypothetical protein [unclassified Ruegeria]|uniref:hypothetical protein n=1 Tax=unclassified Ruegeria TaxID=2625375 RepID=UPI001C1197E1|nr:MULTISPECIES: hypothetical protein [unclassified Ruegeria]
MTEHENIAEQHHAEHGNLPYDPEEWAKRLAEARKQREKVLLNRSPDQNQKKGVSDKKNRQNNMLTRMAITRAQREEVLQKITKQKVPNSQKGTETLKVLGVRKKLDTTYNEAKLVIGTDGQTKLNVMSWASDIDEVEVKKPIQEPPAEELTQFTLTNAEKPRKHASSRPTSKRKIDVEQSGKAKSLRSREAIIVPVKTPTETSSFSKKSGTWMNPQLGVLLAFLIAPVGLLYANSSHFQAQIVSFSKNISNYRSSFQSNGYNIRISPAPSQPKLSVPKMTNTTLRSMTLPHIEERPEAFSKFSKPIEMVSGEETIHVIQTGHAGKRPAIAQYSPVLELPDYITVSNTENWPSPPAPISIKSASLLKEVDPASFALSDFWASPLSLESETFIVVHLPKNLPQERRRSVLERFEAEGISVESVASSPFTIKNTQVRFYHLEDQRMGEDLANFFDGVARDFTSFVPSPKRGLLELWVSGDGAKSAPSFQKPPTVAKPQVVARAVLAKPPMQHGNLFGKLSGIFNSGIERGESTKAGSDRNSVGSGVTTEVASNSTSAGGGKNNASSGGSKSSTGGNVGGSKGVDNEGSQPGKGGNRGGGKAGSKPGGKGGNSGGGKGGKGGNSGGGKGGKGGNSGGGKGGKGGNSGGGKGVHRN